MTNVTPFVSVIIPLRQITHYVLHEGLPAFANQTYKHFEVILLPNKKTKHDALLIKKYPFLKIIETNKITRPAQKRDIGVRFAKGEIIAFIDDDAYPALNWLEKAVVVFSKHETFIKNKNTKDIYAGKVVAVCGPGIIPKNSAFLEKVFDAVLTSPLGSGAYTYRFTPQNSRAVDDFPSMNFLVLADVFKKVGGFNNNFWPGEDSKLCEDLVYGLSSKILYDPSIKVYHHRRPDLGHFLKQHGNYGFHRGAFFAHGDKNSMRLSYLIPTFFVLYLFSLPFAYYLTSINYLLLLSPLFLYKALLVYQILRSYKANKSLKISVFSSIVLFLMHAYYGIRFVYGFVVGFVKKEHIYG